MDWSRPVARILGNFGITFFSPLASIHIGRAIFEVVGSLDFYQTVIVSLLTAVIATGVSISKEAIEYGNRRK